VAARIKIFVPRDFPVFPHRRLRHGFIFVNTSKASQATDLSPQVGHKGYLFTAGLWMRGILEHDYGCRTNRSSGSVKLDEDV